MAAIGYQEVELFSFAKHTPAELKQMVEAAGLKAPAGHCRAEDLKKDTAPLIDPSARPG